MTEDRPAILHPQPQRAAALQPLSPISPSLKPQPSPTVSDLSRVDSTDSCSRPDTLVDRTRSIINLTSSTLFGIYAPSEDDVVRTQPPTPSSAISQTPYLLSQVDDKKRPSAAAVVKSSDVSSPSHANVSARILSLSWRIVLLAAFGVMYGVLINHLHDSEQVAPVQIPSMLGPRVHLLGWGMAGAALGLLLPWIDHFWQTETKEIRPSKGSGADWNPAVRSIGAFIGIAFAIRRLPWQSTLQLSLTLALVNPVLWYLIDRSRTGFGLSLFVGVAGTAGILSLNPGIVPAPAYVPPPQAASTNYHISHLPHLSNEWIGVSTWIASVLFCSSVCFGNIGRRLASGH